MRVTNRRLWLLFSLLLIAALPPEGRSASADSLTPSTPNDLAPGAPSVLLIYQEPNNWPEYSQQVEMLLRHFTPNTTRVSTKHYTDHQLFDFDRVVVVCTETDTPLSPVLLEDLGRADRPVLWLGYNPNKLPVDIASTFGFSLGQITEENVPSWVEYHGQRYPAKLTDYYPVTIVDPSSTQVLATYGGGRAPVPYIVRGNNLWYVNGLPAPSGEYPDSKSDAPFLIFADALHDFFGTSVTASQKAVIRLEDVSVHIPPARLTRVINYLYSERIPFTIGVIPAQRFKDGRIVELSDRPDFVKVLRYAQDHGGTIILHGYHHTFGSGEDYEFWDAKHHAPITGETWDMYADKVEGGIRILRNNGVEPRLWETPHYAGSPLAYRVFSHYFSHAIENRDPVGWLPYPAGPDRYGQMLIPENIGYINPAEGKTVEAQMQRADALRIVRDSWAVGFYHPASIPLSQLKSLVEGLQREGYTFADLRSLPMEVHYDYRPGPLSRFNTWRLVDLRLALDELNFRLESQYEWWPTVRGVPWLPVLLVGSTIIFLFRLRKQWRPAKAAARSVVDSASTLKPGWSSRLAARQVVGLLAGSVIVAGLLLFALKYTPAGGEPDSDRLRGWSSLDWTVAYDGYGKVGVESSSASLKPLAPQRPVESHAALVTSRATNWRDYTFRVQMKLEQQLRQGSRPNSWEAGWLFFRYQGEARSYYLTHKTNGIELGKLVPPEGEGQIFLATKSQPRAVPGRWYDYHIECRGANIKVYVNNKLQIDYTDPDPILRGGVGLYTEDAHVYYRRPTLTKISSRG